MSCINKAILLGNLGRDPEIRTTSDGKPIAQFTLATSETWSAPGGERQTRTEWHRVVVFNDHLVPVVEKFLKKGQKVYVEGQIRSRKWTDQNGQENTIREIVISRFRGDIVLLGERASLASQNESSDQEEPPALDTDSMSDDIPF